MATRNFWIDASIDGRKTPLTGGPRSKDGGFDLRIFMRSDSGIISPVYIRGWAGGDNQLHLDIVADGEVVHQIQTQR
jgi:hypothetical protein